MDLVGDHLLADSGLSLNEHGHVEIGDMAHEFEDLADLRTDPDQTGVHHLFAQMLDLTLRAALHRLDGAHLFLRGLELDLHFQEIGDSR